MVCPMTIHTSPEGHTNTASKLAPGMIYFGDNGRAMCIDCAGYTAKATGRDLSGQPLQVATRADFDAFTEAGLPFQCECGKVRA